jgi:hypothetical protein
MKKLLSNTSFKLRSNVLKKNRRNDRKKITLLVRRFFVLVILLLFLGWCFYSMYVIYTSNQEFNSNLASKVDSLEVNPCVVYKKGYVYSFVVMSYTNDVVHNVYVYVLAEGKKFSIDLSDYEFDLAQGKKGRIADLVYLNRYFIDKTKTIQNLKLWLYEKLRLKVDSVIIIDDISKLIRYVELYSYNWIDKWRKINEIDNNIQIETDMCLDSFYDVITEYFIRHNTPAKQIKYYKDFLMSDILDLDDIKKEQVRIHIVNATGVENRENFVAELLSSYGLNVVKVDFDPEIAQQTTVAIDRQDLLKTHTLQQINYLIFKDREAQYVITDKSIFADVLITLGRDSLK